VLSALTEPSWLKVYRVRVPIPDLPGRLDGFTICQLSDLRRGPLVSEAHIRRGVERANLLDADLVVVTGDFGSVSSRHASSCADILFSLKARHGVDGVLGNDDHRVGAQA